MIKNISLNKILLFLFVISTVFINLNFIAADSMSNEKYNFIIVFLIILKFSLPSIYYYFNHSHYKNIPLIEIVLLFFILSYLTIFFLGESHTSKAFYWLAHSQSEEQQYIFLNIFRDPLSYLKVIYYSLTFFLIGYFLIFLFLKNKANYLATKIKFNSIIHFKHYFFFGIIGFCFKIIIFIFPEILKFNIVNQFKETIFLFSILSFSIIIFHKKNIFFLKIISLIILPLLFIIDLTETGSQMGTTLMFTLIVLNYWLIKKRIFFIGIIFIVFNFYFFQDIKIEYRTKLTSVPIELRKPFIKITKYINSLSFNYFEKIKLKVKDNVNFYKLTEKDSLLLKNEKDPDLHRFNRLLFYINDAIKEINPNAEFKIIDNDLFNIQWINGTIPIDISKILDKASEIKYRTDLINKNRVSSARLTISSVGLNKILDKHSKNELKLKYGETYKPLPFFFIPRILWTNKPTSSFGIEYGLVTEMTVIELPTSINVSWISESFWNFGNYFFIPMFIKGILLASLSFLFVYRGQCYIFYSWLVAIIPIVIADSNFALIFPPIFFKFFFLITVISIYKFFFISNEKN